jgi:ubiquinone/menaquinone biosynthesis C-methylase UbiE
MNSKRYFDTMADQWDVFRKHLFPTKIRQIALNKVNIQPGEVAADIGAGTGFLTESLIEKGMKVIAVDQSEAMLRQLQVKFPLHNDVDCRVGEAEDLPVESGSVDYVFANMYLHHADHPLEAIKEMARILKPGGQLIITDMEEHDCYSLRMEHNDEWMGFSKKEMRKWFLEAGLKKVRIDHSGENCCTDCSSGDESVNISILIAHGQK